MLAWALLAGAAAATLAWGWVALVSGAGAVLDHPLDEPTAEPVGPLAGVTVVVPGRDEADHLPQTLQELLAQDTRRPHRVVFVDDASSDATPEAVAGLAAAFGDRLLPVRNEQEPPRGWVGKCWAIQRGLAAAGLLADGPVEDAAPADPGGSGGDWLLFTDADIHHAPDLVRAAAAHAEARGADVLALVPRLVFGGFGERLVQLQLVVALSVMLPLKKAVDPGRPEALTGGAFILVRRRLYAAAGGHAAVRGEVVEDLKLGQALKAAGGRMAVAVAGERLWCRMYDGWADQWEGLTKNAYPGLDRRPLVAAGLGAATLVCNVGPAAYLPAALALAGSGGGAAAWVAAGVAMLALALQAASADAARRLCGLRWWWALSVPAGSAAYLAILAASAWRCTFGGNLWKGRRYPAPPAAE
ncbi:putative glycosyltransferase [Phycisphaera mikurensis NBRC 102666]|uniref:Putative glycosyltransferase n=1 Tax=Phycisphaera mikurensis (strain NBRC 102666 / KCTC 22515 / FYK2301M01) TaxID=1142394 RepID=I0IBU2_PHYMF|nr:putative glycosyltransferase [Phycisphaera mikurensis NBRC 102666]